MKVSSPVLRGVRGGDAPILPDILAIIHVCRASTRARFANSYRLYGLRKYKKQVTEDVELQGISEQGTREDMEKVGIRSS